jgi:beta-lactamase class A
MNLPTEYGMAWSVHAFDIDTNEVLISHNPDSVLSTASVGKLFLLHTLLTGVDNGDYSLEDLVTRRPSEYMDESGLWHLLQVDTLTLYDVAVLIGATSDNAATNTLTRVIGLERVQAHTRALGYQHSAMNDVIRWPIPPGKPERLSEGSAAELSEFMARLATDQDLTAESADVFRTWLGAGMDLSMIGAGFDFDPLAHNSFDRGVWIVNKTGTISTVRADIGIVMGRERRVAYAVIANWDAAEDTLRDEPRTLALRTMKQLGLQFGDHVRWGRSDFARDHREGSR